MLLIMLVAVSSPVAAGDIVILCYHDVGKAKNVYTIEQTTLKSHFDYLKEKGYTPISFQEFMLACKEGAPLPPKPVMLTFDDGYEAFYTKIFPLLKEYNYPAVMSIVTSWLEYASSDLGSMLTWQQLREMDASGLVTIASHSHMSHRYTIINPQGDRGSLMGNLQYRNGQYESIDDYRQRIRSDLQTSQAIFARELGHKARAMVWPYGSYTSIAADIAFQEGFEACFALNDGFNRPDEQTLRQARRTIIMGSPTKKKFAKLLQDGGLEPVKAAQLDLDMIYDAKDAAQMEENLNKAIERLLVSGINTVYLQAFSDDDGSGDVKSVYFHTEAAPVKADLFSHAVARLQEEGNFAVYAWMPTLAAQWLTADRVEDAVVAYNEENRGWYHRATPFSPQVEQRLEELFADLAAYSNIDGVLFQDDLYLNDFEDFSPAARQAFKQATGRELTAEILKEPGMMKRWTQMKTDALTNLTMKLAAVVRKYRPDAAIARNIYPTLITEPESEEWFAQNYNQYLQVYDYTVIMAYPYLEKEYEAPVAWLEKLAAMALQDKNNAQKTVFKLQTYDWNKNRWLSARELKQHTEALQRKGAVHIAHYPENVFAE